MAAKNHKSGILIVFESDGSEWADHLAELLRNEPYRITCVTEHLWNLKLKTANLHPVHLLLLTPIMATQINNDKISLLDYKSDNSLLLECNVDSKELRMHMWTVREMLDTSEEKQRQILTTLVEMYERATGDQDNLNPDEIIYIDIVPTILYPGDRVIHILFSTEPQGAVTIRLEGTPNRIPTKKHTKSSYTCELPDTDAGQKITSVYVEGLPYSLYTTKIAFVTAECLLENFIENFEKTLEIRPRSNARKSWHLMGLFFNPFSEYLCSKDNQINFAQHLTELLKNVDPTQRDSGFSADENYYERIPGQEGEAVPFRTPENEEMFRMSTRYQSEPCEQKRPSSFISTLKKMFGGKKQPKPKSATNSPRKYSRRAMAARSQKLYTIPDLPPRRMSRP